MAGQPIPRCCGSSRLRPGPGGTRDFELQVEPDGGREVVVTGRPDITKRVPQAARASQVPTHYGSSTTYEQSQNLAVAVSATTGELP